MKKDEIGTLMDEEIINSWDELKNLQPGTQERKDAVDELEKLMGMRAQKSKTNAETLDRYVQWALKIMEIGLPLAAYGAWFKFGLHYESTGEAFISPVFRSLWNRWVPTRVR